MLGGLDLSKLVTEARAAWPDFTVDPQVFLEHLESRIEADQAELHAADLYLACACAHRVKRALEIFELEFVPVIERAFTQIDGSASFKEEMRARVRDGLLSGRLLQYNGRGPLKGWIRVVAIREALLALRKSSKEVSADDARLDERAAGDDQELAHLKRIYRGEFSEAFRFALAQLESRDRNLLRHHHLDGLTIDDLAQMYGTHRATTARWLNRVREKLLQETRAQLTSRLKIDEAELESIMRLIGSDLDVSFRSLL